MRSNKELGNRDFTMIMTKNGEVIISIPSLFEIIYNRIKRFFGIGWTHIEITRKDRNAK